MKIKNSTNELRTTWTGQDVNPGDVLYTDGMPDNEVAWLLRHGFAKVTKPKQARPTTDVDTQPPFTDDSPVGYKSTDEEVVAEIKPTVTRRKRKPRR